MTSGRACDEGQPREPSRGSPFARRARWSERIAEGAIRSVALLSIASVLLILLFIGKEALPLVTSSEVRQEVTLGSMIVGPPSWQPVSAPPRYSVLPLALGTLKVTVVALAIACPISVAAAAYVSELAGPRTRELVKPIVELLAGVPSVVVGFFALAVLATWIQRVFGFEHRLNALVAGAGLAFAICPIVFSVTEDALRAVPPTFRTAATALGSTRADVLLRIVLPTASPGIAAAIVLGFGRAVGETMIVLLASGNAALFDLDLGHSTRTVTATIAQELGEVVVGSAHFHVLFGLGAILFLATLAIDLVGVHVVRKMRRRLGVES